MLKDKIKKANRFSAGFCKAKKCQGLPMSTIVLVILVVIAIAVIILFVFNMNKSGQEQTQGQVDIGISAGDVAACKLWASGLNNNFKCNETECPEDSLCKRWCSGEELAYKTSPCKPTGFDPTTTCVPDYCTDR